MYPYVVPILLGTGTSAGQTISATGTYTTTFMLGPQGPAETLVFQGVRLDPSLSIALQGYTGYQSGGTWTMGASYIVMRPSPGIPFPYSATHTVYYGTYQFL